MSASVTNHCSIEIHIQVEHLLLILVNTSFCYNAFNRQKSYLKPMLRVRHRHCGAISWYPCAKACLVFVFETELLHLLRACRLLNSLQSICQNQRYLPETMLSRHLVPWSSPRPSKTCTAMFCRHVDIQSADKADLFHYCEVMNCQAISLNGLQQANQVVHNGQDALSSLSSFFHSPSVGFQRHRLQVFFLMERQIEV